MMGTVSAPVMLPGFPDTIMVVGTDASGKDHVANVLDDMIQQAGGDVTRRKRYLAGKTTRERSSSGKSHIELFLERGFLKCFPLCSFLMPVSMNYLLKRDLAAYRAPEEGKLIVVGHNCLRGLAFYWGHHYATPEQIRVPSVLSENLESLRALPGLHTIVLDVEDSIRKARIRKRAERGEADYFDRYMAANEELSERIERFLVWLSVKYLGATLIENNDLDKDELCNQITKGFREAAEAI